MEYRVVHLYNESKTVCSILHHARSIIIMHKGLKLKLDREPVYPDLWVTLDRSLVFKPHLQGVANKE